MDVTFNLARRYRGALENGQFSGHGGYFCGEVAERVPGLSALTIRKRIPLERGLTIKESSGRITVHDGDDVVGDSEVRDGRIRVTLPAPISLEEALDAGKRFAGFSRPEFFECFVCGCRREPGDGLRIFTGEVGEPINGEKQLAGVWYPHASMLSPDGFVKPELIWAALDCPGGWAIPKECKTLVLQVDILAPVPGGCPVVVRGWLQEPVDGSRSSRFAGSALLDESGNVLALGGAKWIRDKS